MQKIAIFGGTFDPIHQGHLHLAQQAIAQLGLTRLLLLPSAEVAHKTTQVLFSYDERCRLCREACAHIPQITVSTLEQTLTSRYSYDVVHTVAQDHPDAQLFFLIGGDNMDSFPYWFQAEALCQLATLVVMPRQQEDVHTFTHFQTRISQMGRSPILLDAPLSACQSHAIRTALRHGDTQPSGLPFQVLQRLESEA